MRGNKGGGKLGYMAHYAVAWRTDGGPIQAGRLDVGMKGVRLEGGLHRSGQLSTRRLLYRDVMEAKDETIRVLQHQLEEEREARRRADTIIAQLTQLNVALTARVPSLGDSPTELPDTEAVATVEGGATISERRGR